MAPVQSPQDQALEEAQQVLVIPIRVPEMAWEASAEPAPRLVRAVTPEPEPTPRLVRVAMLVLALALQQLVLVLPLR